MTLPTDMITRPAPDFSLPLVGGGRLALYDLRGSVVVLHFWSAECPWSRRADLVLVYRQMAWERKNVRTLGVACNANEPESEIKYEAELRRVKYPIAIDALQEATVLYRVQVTPHFIVLDPRGLIRYSGALDDGSVTHRLPKTRYLDLAVEAALKEQSPSPAVTLPYGSTVVRPAPSADVPPALPAGR
jgi:peroxiredoxin